MLSIYMYTNGIMRESISTDEMGEKSRYHAYGNEYDIASREMPICW